MGAAGGSGGGSSISGIPPGRRRSGTSSGIFGGSPAGCSGGGPAGALRSGSGFGTGASGRLGSFVGMMLEPIATASPTRRSPRGFREGKPSFVRPFAACRPSRRRAWNAESSLVNAHPHPFFGSSDRRSSGLGSCLVGDRFRLGRWTSRWLGVASFTPQVRLRCPRGGTRGSRHRTPCEHAIRHEHAIRVTTSEILARPFMGLVCRRMRCGTSPSCSAAPGDARFRHTWGGAPLRARFVAAE